MYKFILSFSFLFFSLIVTAQNVGIGTTTPNASAILDASSTTQGFLPPRMTYAQRNAIVNPAAGLIVYCTDCANGEMQFYNGTNWINMSVGLGSAPFTTPVITTNAITSITIDGAVCGGNITTDGGAIITARGVCWSINVNPTIALSTKTIDGLGVGNYLSTMTGLNANTSYYVRAYATNNIGTSYGNNQLFTTFQQYSYLQGPNFNDIDGNSYTSITTICGQTWSAKNLNVSHYRNGDVIPQVTDPAQWANLNYGAWCWYNNDASTNGATYGKLYNWYAVNDPRGLTPIGWHIPSDLEWNNLIKCLDSSSDTTIMGVQNALLGGSIKEAGLLHWLSPNTGATNISGITGIPGGARYETGTFNGIGKLCYLWSSTEQDSNYAWVRLLYNNASYIVRMNYPKKLGFSIRCLRD